MIIYDHIYFCNIVGARPPKHPPPPPGSNAYVVLERRESVAIFTEKWYQFLML
jgi:hypothetical protein